MSDSDGEDEYDEETYTPFMLGKIPYGKIRSGPNFGQLQQELQVRGLRFEGCGWKQMIALLKKDEKDNHCFKPRVGYDRFIICD